MSLISIPDSLIVLVGLDSIKGVVNSEFSSINAREQKTELWNSFNNIFNIILWISLILVLIILIFRTNVIDILLPGFSDGKRYLAISISLIIFPIFLFKALIGTLHSFFNALKRFYFPVAVNIIPTIFMIIAIYLPYFNNELIYNLSFASLISNILILILTLILLYHIGGKIRFVKISLDDRTKKILKGCFSIFMLLVSEQLFNFSKNFLASYFGEGAISSLNYAKTIPNVIMGLIFASFFSVLLSNLSSMLEVEKKIKSKNIFVNTILSLLFLVIPIIIFFILNDKEALSLLYLRGNFTLEAIDYTVKPFLWEVLSLFNFVFYIICTALYLANKKYSLINKIGSSVYISGIFINYLVSKYYGYYGIAVGSFITTFLYAFFLIMYSQKFLGSYKKEYIKIIKIIFSGILTFIVIFLLKYILFLYIDHSQINNVLFLALNATIIILLYLLIAHLFKINLLTKIKSILLAR